MSGVGKRDRRLGELSWAHAADVEEAGATRFAERVATSPKPLLAAVNAAGLFLGASAYRLQVGEVAAAVALWHCGLAGYCRAHAVALAEEGVGGAAHLLDRVLAAAVVAGADEMIAEVLAAHDLAEVIAPSASEPRPSGLMPWGRVLYPLVAGDHDALEAGAAAYREAVPPGKERRARALPALGEAALAIASGDADAFGEALERVLAGQQHAVTRGFLKGSVGFCHEAAALWRLARDAGLEVAVDERFHAVPVPCGVAGELELDGDPVRGARFRWPLDLLPTAFYERVRREYAGGR